MKSVVAFTCLLAVASAGYINAPIVGPAVAYAAYEDGAYRGEGLYESQYKGEGLIESQDLARVAVAAPIIAAHSAPIALAAHALPLASEARLIDPVAIAAGAPLPTGDTVEVAAAKAAHLQAHAVAKGLAYGAPIATIAAPSVLAAHAYAAPAYAAHAYAAPAVALASQARLVDPVAIAAGAPLPTGDTVEVAAAKAAHFAAHAAAKGHIIAKRSPGYLNPLAYSVASPALPLASEARLIDPVAIAAGAPLPTGDTVEVAAAKAAHLQAHAVAKGLAYGAPIATIAAPSVLAAHAVPLVSEPRLIDPVAIAAGAPLPTGDTVEVAAAKAAHLQAHAVANGLAYGAPIATIAAPSVLAAHAYAAPAIALASQARLVDPIAIAAGAPLPTGDTVEVAHAKAVHFAAHAAAKGHIIAKRSPVLLPTPLVRSYGYSTLAAHPLAYSPYGYGRLYL